MNVSTAVVTVWNGAVDKVCSWKIWGTSESAIVPINSIRREIFNPVKTNPALQLPRNSLSTNGFLGSSISKKESTLFLGYEA
jgi:hypothetical protein